MRWILVGVALVLGAGLLLWLAWAGACYSRTEYAIASFEANPSAVTARVLANVLNERLATPRQGTRILQLVLRPKVTTRKAYPTGQTVRIRTEMPFRVPLYSTDVKLEQCIWLPDLQRVGGNTILMEKIAPVTQLLEFHPPSELPGNHTVDIHVSCTVRSLKRLGPPLWKRLIHGYASSEYREITVGTYTCSFDVPVEIAVVDPENAERIELVSNPQIDEAMRASFRPSYWRDAPLVGHTRTGLAISGDMVDLICENPRMNVVFRAMLRLSDGRLISQRDEHPIQFRQVPDGQSTAYMNPVDFALEEPGEYTGAIVLSPDPNFAYEDPTIKAIWNGTLEFPIRFTISRERNPMR